MNKRLLTLACIFVGALGAWAPGPATAIMVIVDSPEEADPLTIDGIPYLSYHFTVDEEGADIRGFDFRFLAPSMNQIHVPDQDFDGEPEITVFQDWNHLIDEAEDSQVEFFSFVWDTSVADVDTETPGELAGGVAEETINLPSMFNLAHIVIPATHMGDWEFTPLIGPDLELGDPLSGVFGIPEASQIIAGTAIAVALLGLQVIRRLSKRAATA
jgi:hypothetical protein